MQKFIDRRGRVWIVDIDNTTLRRVKTLTDVRLLDAIDGDLITRLSSDPLLLGDVLFAICKPQADQQDVDDEAFAEGLAGDAIDEACKAVVDALVAYFPESRRRLLRKAAEKQKMIETRGLEAIDGALDDPTLVDRIVERSGTKTRGADVERHRHRLAGIVGVDPGPLTLRQLMQMADANRQHDWNIAISVMALTAEINRDRRRRRKPFKPDDFNPLTRVLEAGSHHRAQLASLLGDR